MGGLRWKALSAEEKAPYEHKAQLDKERHRKEKEEYDLKLAMGTTSDESGALDDAPLDFPSSTVLMSSTVGDVGIDSDLDNFYMFIEDKKFKKDKKLKKEKKEK